MFKKILVLIFLVIGFWLLVTLTYAQQNETLTITTYYPSPYGSYRELETEILHFRESTNGLINFNYPDSTYDRRLRITAGRDDTGDNNQGASIDLHGNIYAGGGRLDLVAGRNSYISFWTSPTGSSAQERMRIISGGNVGIGTTSPDGKLNIAGGSTWTTNGWRKGLRFDGISAIELGGNGTTRFGSGVSGNKLYYFYTGTETGSGDSAHYYMSVNSTGNVGIGTTSPTAKLEVAGQIKIQGGNPAAGRVLTSDANGVGSWQEKIGYANSDYQCRVFCWTFYGSPWSNYGYSTAVSGQSICLKLPDPFVVGGTYNVQIVSKTNCRCCHCR